MPDRLQKTIYGIALVATLALLGCGTESDVPSQDGSTTTAVAEGQPASVDGTDPNSGPSEGTGADSTSTVEEPAADASSTAPAAQSIDQRLENLLAGQDALNRRLDSLLAGSSPATPAGPTSATAAVAEPSESQAPGSGEVLGEARDKVRSFGVGIFWSVLVLIAFSFLIRTIVWVLGALSEQSAERRLFYKRLVPIVRIILWIFAGYLIVRVIFRVDAQGFFAASAAVGVAVGFAAQDLLKNLFGGLILVFDQPFQVGDKISVGGTYGEVVSIGLRSTRIVTSDDNLVSVPNAQVVDQQVANANAGELNCQVVTDLYLPGFVDESKASKIAFEAAASSKYVYLKKPIVTLVKDEFKETFLTRIRVKAYVLDPRFEFQFQSDVTERARAGFREAGLMRPEHGMRAFLDLSHAGPQASGAEDEHGES